MRLTPSSTIASQTPSNLPTPHASDRGHPGEPQKAPFGVRMVDIAARASDGSTIIGQRRIPALAKFDQAFAAFAQGTLFQADHGLIAIEDLQPGDRLMTTDGRAEMVTWIGSASFAPGDESNKMRLTRIMADSFGMNRPDSFISLGTAARVLHTPPHLRSVAETRRLMTPAYMFVDGVNVIDVMPPTSVRLFHIALAQHASVFAGGLEVETYHPGPQPLHGLSHTLRSVFLSMFPQIEQIADFGAVRYPRAPEENSQTAA